MWHRIFGQDVTLWGPTHLLLFGGASLSTLGAMILLMEGATAAREVRPQRATRTVRLQQVLLGGAFLIGLSTFQGEFDYSVPQFRLVFHPILLMLASSVALVAVRIWAGKGAAIGAALFFILIRGTLTLLVSPLFGHTLLHFPLYIVEAVVVEAVALRVARDKPLTLGLLAGRRASARSGSPPSGRGRSRGGRSSGRRACSSRASSAASWPRSRAA